MKVEDYFNKSGFRIFGQVEVQVKDPLPDFINLDDVLYDLQKLIPKSLTVGLKGILIGRFDFLMNNEYDAVYYKNYIYMTNEQESNESMMDDIIHEIAHFVENKYKDQIYKDGSLAREFLRKRERLFNQLREDFPEIEKRKAEFAETEYSLELDAFLYKEVGYNHLGYLTVNSFCTPYGATSLREYWANGFENYVLKDDMKTFLSKNCKELHSKIKEIVK